MRQQPATPSVQRLSDAEIRAVLYFAVGVTSESGEKSYRLVVAGDRASTPAIEPADNSGYSIGTLQTDLGQHYQPRNPRGENVPRDLVDAYQTWARANRREWVLDDAQRAETIADLGRQGNDIRNDGGRPLDAVIQRRLDAFLASDDGIGWVHGRDVAQVDKLMRNAMPALTGSGLYATASPDDQMRLVAIVGKVYNQNEARAGTILRDLRDGRYADVDAISTAVDRLVARSNDYFEGGRDKALRGAEVAVALRGVSADSPLRPAWASVLANPVVNPTQLDGQPATPDLPHHYPTIRNLFVQYDKALPFIAALDRGSAYAATRADAQHPERFTGRGLVASGDELIVWDTTGRGHGRIGGEWQHIDRDSLTRAAPSRGVIDVGIDDGHSPSTRIRVDPQAPPRRRAGRGDDAPGAGEAVRRPQATTDPLHRQAEDAVRRLDAEVGRPFDRHSACMAASLACLARESGFERIDHVVVNVATASLQKGENVFVVQGGLTEPTNRVAYMKTHDALAMPAEHSLDRLSQLASQRTLDVPTHQAEAQAQQPAHRHSM